MSMDEQRRQRGPVGWWRTLSALVNGDREDSKAQYIAFGLVIVFCIVFGVVIDIIAG